MPTNTKPPVVRRGFVILISLSLLALYVAVAIPKYQRSVSPPKITEESLEQSVNEQNETAVKLSNIAIEFRSNSEISDRNSDALKRLDDRIAMMKIAKNPIGNDAVPPKSLRKPRPIVMASSKSYQIPGEDMVWQLKESVRIQQIINPPIPTSAKSEQNDYLSVNIPTSSVKEEK